MYYVWETTSISKLFSPCPLGCMKKRQACTRVSTVGVLHSTGNKELTLVDCMKKRQACTRVSTVGVLQSTGNKELTLVGCIKKRQACTRVSTEGVPHSTGNKELTLVSCMKKRQASWSNWSSMYSYLCTLCSASKNLSNWSSMYLVTGSQHWELFTASPKPENTHTQIKEAIARALYIFSK